MKAKFYRNRKQVNSYLSMGGEMRWEGGVTKGHKESFYGNGHVQYLVCGEVIKMYPNIHFKYVFYSMSRNKA